MKTNMIKNAIKGIGLGMFMVLGLMAFSATEANALRRNRDNRQERRDDRDNQYGDYNNRYSNPLYRVARENGFRDGQAEGRQDRRDRDRDNLYKSKEYKKATNGYYKALGNKNEYREAYRQAFVQGYNQTYNRRRRGNNNNYGY